MKTKIVAMLLALAMVVSLVPMTTLGVSFKPVIVLCTHENTHVVQTIIEATCTEDGNIHNVHVCNKCEKETKEEDFPIPATGHKWSNGSCSVCGLKQPVVIIPLCKHAKTHTKQTITEATCTEAGNIHDAEICDSCGKEVSAKDYPIEAAGHKWADGACSVCGLKQPVVIIPLCKHAKTHTKQTITEATCTEDGNIHDAKICDSCGKEVSAKDYPIEAAGHKWADGACSVCGLKQPVVIIPLCQHAKTHTKQTITEATCTEDGNIHDAKICDSCGKEVSAKDYPIEAAGHKWADGACSVCGLKQPVVIIPLCKHAKTHTKQTITEATCTEDGNIHDAKICDSCGKEVSAKDYPIEAAGHKWADGACSVCGLKQPVVIIPLCQHKNHDYVNNGSNHTVICDDCSKSLYTEDHDFSESGTCVCGAAEPKCDHNRQGHSIVNNGDGTHSTLCAKCKAVLHTEAHSFSDLHNCGCGAVKPFYVPEEEPIEEAPYYPEDSWNRLDDLFVTFK